MSTDLNTPGAQAPSVPSAPKSWFQKNILLVAVSMVAVIALAVIAVLLSARDNSNAAPVAAVLPTAIQEPVVATTTQAPPVATATPAPVVVAPVTTPTPVNPKLLTKPVDQTDYEGWVKYLQSVFVTASATNDRATLNANVLEDCLFQHNTTSVSGDAIRCRNGMTQKFGTSLGKFQGNSVVISEVHSGIGFDAAFSQGSGTFSTTYLWNTATSSWVLEIFRWND